MSTRANCVLCVLSIVCLESSSFAQEAAWPGETSPVLICEKAGPAPKQLEILKGHPGFRALYSISPSGDDAELLLAAPGSMINTDPQVSHDGKFIVFSGFPKVRANTEAKVLVTALDGPYRGTILDYGYGIEPSWSPDGRQIGYAALGQHPGGARPGVWVMDVDGSNRHWHIDGLFPRWSPDGKQMLVEGSNQHGSTIIVLDLANGAKRDLLGDTGWTVNSYAGNWSTDGNRIVFVGKFQQKDRLAIYDLTAQRDPIRILCTSDDGQVSFHGPPAWSPDGHQIVFNTEDDTDRTESGPRSYLYSLAADVPSAPILLEKQMAGHINRGMTFTPDGKRIIFSSER